MYRVICPVKRSLSAVTRLQALMTATVNSLTNLLDSVVNTENNTNQETGPGGAGETRIVKTKKWDTMQQKA